MNFANLVDRPYPILTMTFHSIILDTRARILFKDPLAVRPEMSYIPGLLLDGNYGGEYIHVFSDRFLFKLIDLNKI